ncbi:GNAT family N-acetyltransferase [Oceanobacillus chungangensis]|uniref:GNAT family N-acetyltransferase n=1 Tax=Oceanobacillus chungangensis TaxID=1229152 RepID=A0A3D8PG27_9BACI|nr:GNAT family N-acetyltransferase [Oceanobacillus chungangensis]RDW15036.1 GNAT family N-acetyltransferase [Oceanobacillus chungangensis]
MFREYEFDNYMVRIAEETDTESVIRLLQDTASSLQKKGILQWEYLLLGEDTKEIEQGVVAGTTYVVEANGEMVAAFNFSSKQNDWDIALWGKRNDAAYYIHRLAVNPKYRHQQIGRKLLSWIDHNLKLENGSVRLDCIANNPVLNKFYLDAGFTFVGYGEQEEERFSKYEKIHQVEKEE